MHIDILIHGIRTVKSREDKDVYHDSTIVLTSLKLHILSYYQNVGRSGPLFFLSITRSWSEYWETEQKKNKFRMKQYRWLLRRSRS